MTRRIKLYTADDEYKEAAFIAGEIEKLVGGLSNLTGDNTHYDSAYGFADIAVLFRTRAVGKGLLTSFKQSGIPVRFGDASSFLVEYPFHLITDVIRLYLNAKDMIALDSVLTHGLKMGKKEKQEFLSSHPEVERFTSLFGEAGTASFGRGAMDAVKFIFERFIPDETLDDAGLLRKEAIVDLAKEYGADIGQFVYKLLLDTYTDVARLKTDAVSLLTFHASKGLEFPVVFIAGAEEGITPVLRKDTNIEEERRLFYVALTRAKDALFVTHTAQRRSFNETEVKTLSRFVGEIPASLIETVKKKQPRAEQMKLF